MSAISTDMRHINLWKLLTDCPLDASARSLAVRHNIGREVQGLLNQAKRVDGQELNLDVDDQGWTITVYSCWRNDRGLMGADDYLFKVYIPKDKHEAIRFEVDDGHKAAMYQRKWKPGKVWTRIYKFIGRTRVFTGRNDKP